jgi:hypothetical protein
MDHPFNHPDSLRVLEEIKLELDQLGSVIFPMKGNEKFEAGKLGLKLKIKMVKQAIQSVKESRE